MKLDENTLFIWDVETLYITYNMQKQSLKNMCLDENANGGSFNYKDYKVEMQKYSDTFDYGTWRRTYTKCTTKEAQERLNDVIMNYYNKFFN